MRRASILLAVAAMLLAAPAPASAAKLSPAGTVKLGSTSTAQLARTGKVAVRVGYPRSGRVRVFVTLRGTRTGFARARSIRLRKRGSKRVVLTLTQAGRRAAVARARDCRPLALTLRTRGQRYVLRRVHPSPFSQRNRVGRQRNRVRAFSFPAARGCRAAGAPARPQAPASGGQAGTGSPAPPGSAGPGGPPGTSRTRAGAASSDITPPVGTPMFAYTARSNIADPPTDLDQALQIIGDPDTNLYAKSFEPSEGIHTRVRANALVVEQAGRKFALVQVDLGGLPYALTQAVVARIAATGIPADRLMISATHTHASTGPIWPVDNAGYALLGGDAFDPRIFDLTAEGIAEAVRNANERLEPARLGVGSATLTDASRNREFDTYKRNPEAPADDAAARAASIDDKLWVVRADASDGRPLAAWSNFAVHPTSFGDDNLFFSGDNVASAERIATEEITRQAAADGNPVGADRAFVNVWTNGNQGDISPNGGPDQDGGDALQYVPNASASANMAGRRVAGGIVAAWRDAGDDMSGSLELDARRTLFAFDGTPFDGGSAGSPVGPLPVLGVGGIVGPDGTCGVSTPGQLPKQTGATGPLAPNTAPVSVWRVGGLGIVGLPSEVTKTQGQRIKNALVASSQGRIGDFALAGLTNSYLSYTATPEEYDACTYEGSFTLFGRLQGPRYGAAAQGVLTALLAGQDPATLPEPPPTGLGGNVPTVDQTPDAGTVVTEPADTARMRRATFVWKGGDSAADAPRNQTFVRLQRRVAGDWTTVGTDDGFHDTTAYDDDTSEWTETWQFGECDPLGEYRFVVTGVADKGTGSAPYTVTSDTFELTAAAALVVDPVSVSGGTASVVARYADPGPDILTALPRRVRTGTATLRVDGDPVTAQPDSSRLRFSTPVPAGATVTVDQVRDGCGNAGS